MIAVMAFALRQVLRRRHLRGLSSLEVSGRLLLGFGQAFGATEIDRTVEEPALKVLARNFFSAHRTGLDAVAFAQKLALGGLGRRSVCLGMSFLVMREGL